MTIGGDLIEIKAVNGQVGTFTFYPKSNETIDFTPSGVITESDENGISGGGNEMIWKKNQRRASLSVVCANDMVTRMDLENARALQNSSVETTFTWTHVSGAVYKIVGFPVGDLSADLQAGTFTMEIEGIDEKIG